MKNKFIKEGYNKIAFDYSSTRDQFKNIKYLEKLNLLLKPNSTILDIGCGSGIPIDKFFIEKGHKVIGIDISEEQIKLAKRNLPEGKFEVQDMTDLKDDSYKVDAVVSFYAIFHIPKEEHKEIFRKINSFLKDDGLLLITMGASEWEGTEDFHGAKIFWSHYGPEKNLEIVKNAGFEVLESVIDTVGGENHQVILAKKIK
jgi:cyclopropane fatty-acyl-phospholipid synthase-like methyltransferase